jgi:hypothetical protein
MDSNPVGSGTHGSDRSGIFSWNRIGDKFFRFTLSVVAVNGVKPTLFDFCLSRFSIVVSLAFSLSLLF